MSESSPNSADDLDRDYSRAGFGKRLGFGLRPALLIVDFVNAYLNQTSPLYAGVEAVVSPAAEILRAARHAEIPVIFTQVVFEKGGVDGGLFYRKVEGLALFQGESEAGSIIPALTPLPSELVIRKQYASAFFGTPLSAVLASLQRDSVIITGLSTSGCVRATAVDAVQYGYIPIVVREAVGDRDARPHESALFDLDAKYADVVSCEETKRYLKSLSA